MMRPKFGEIVSKSYRPSATPPVPSSPDGEKVRTRSLHHVYLSTMLRQSAILSPEYIKKPCCIDYLGQKL